MAVSTDVLSLCPGGGEMKKPTVGSLFSGIGGMDLGLERAGFEVRWQVEIDDYCTRVLAKHWPDVPRYGDIREIDGATLERVDLIAGGFPCQPTSNSGLKLAQQDERWLWPEMARLICECRPVAVLVENTRGLLSRGIADVLWNLADLGFDAEWALLSASSFGAPHQRERVYILAYSNGIDGQKRLGYLTKWTEPLLPKGHRQRAELWLQTPDLTDRVGNGISAGIYGPPVKALGNSVVPEVIEYIGRQLARELGVSELMGVAL